MLNCWILQSNPKYFRILDWLRDFPWLRDKPLPDCWHISRFKEEVSPGDTVFIWKSKGRSDIRGIYTKGTVVEPKPEKFPLADRETDYFIGEKGKVEMERLQKLQPLAVRYTRLYLDKPLLSDAIKEVSELRGLTILKKGGACSRGIHKIAPGQCRIIESLLNVA